MATIVQKQVRKNKGRPSQYTLYTITCLENGKVYIGVATWFNERVGSHFSALKRGVHANIGLQKDFNLYGKDGFCVDVVNRYDSKFEAARIEKYYTDHIFVKNQNICYNIISGGIDVASQIRKRYNDGVRKDAEHQKMVSEKLSKSLKGRIFTEETKRKLSAKAKARIVSKETRLKFSKKRALGGNPRAKRCVNIVTGVEYSSLKEASIDMGVNYDCLRARIDNNYSNNIMKWLQ